MKILALLALGVLLTGCAAADNSVPLASPSQVQSAEVESQTDAPEEPQSEPAVEESATEESASPAPAQIQSVRPTTTKPPQPSQTAEPGETKTPEPAPEPTPEPTPEPVESQYSMANIAKNNSSSSCWTAISGKAYNLTAWISSHPGGDGAIVSICGTNATSTFQGKHGGQSGPASALTRYLLGDVTE